MPLLLLLEEVVVLEELTVLHPFCDLCFSQLSSTQYTHHSIIKQGFSPFIVESFHQIHLSKSVPASAAEHKPFVHFATDGSIGKAYT
ncbi:hypothetical protein J5751_00770 [bacterium]|nr:hypothetical protein [bacterium]